jgi:hypothetical protein
MTVSYQQFQGAMSDAAMRSRLGLDLPDAAVRLMRSDELEAGLFYDSWTRDGQPALAEQRVPGYSSDVHAGVGFSPRLLVGVGVGFGVMIGVIVASIVSNLMR